MKAFSLRPVASVGALTLVLAGAGAALAQSTGDTTDLRTALRPAHRRRAHRRRRG